MTGMQMGPLVEPEDDRVWVAAIDNTCQLSCPTMTYRGFEEILIGQPWHTHYWFQFAPPDKI
jgi:hypothetical protein